jgi:gamma-glutamyltranspeptidase/glutathione hydrolase/leukotriene-C4 hydrolase
VPLLLRVSQRALYTDYTMILSWFRDSGNSLLPHLEKRTFIKDERRCRRRVREVLLVLLLLIVAASSSRHRQIIPHLFSTSVEEAVYSLRNPAYLIKVKHGAVASENELCSNIGVKILKEGGNAVDAAVATTFCIGVANMFS